MSQSMQPLDVTYCIVPWNQVWYQWVGYLTRYYHLFILCDLWPSPVPFSRCTVLYILAYTDRQTFALADIQEKETIKQEAFRERRHLHVCDIWPWRLTLALRNVLYLGTRYDVCGCNGLRHITISSFFVTFDLRLWPSSSVKVTFIFIIRWTLYCCVLVPST